MESKSGQMELNTRVNGRTIKQKEKALFGMLKEMCTMESLKMIRLTGMEFTRMLTGRGMKGIGRMTCKKDMDKKFGVMELSIQVTIKKGRSITTEYMNGLMDQSMKATGMRIRLRALGSTYGLMEEGTKDIGLIITCMARVPIPGKTAGNTMETITWTRNKVSVSISGLMVESMKASGKTVNKTGRVSIIQLMGK